MLLKTVEASEFISHFCSLNVQIDDVNDVKMIQISDIVNLSSFVCRIIDANAICSFSAN